MFCLQKVRVNFDNQDLVQLEAQVFFTEFLVCSNGSHYTCSAGVFLKAVIYVLLLLLFLIM